MLTVGLEDQLRGVFQWRPQGPLLHRCFFSRILTIFILFHQRTKQVFMVMERTRFILKALMCNFCFIVFKKSITLVLSKAQQVFDFSDT